jgi:hypothetical protein
LKGIQQDDEGRNLSKLRDKVTPVPITEEKSNAPIAGVLFVV